jgi:choline dehydrogenase-like flavoprotein
MGKPSVVIVGSGAGGSVAAWALTNAGHPVLILEKGRNLIPGLGGSGPLGSTFGNDDVKGGRAFENQDPVLEPRTLRTQLEATQGTERSFVGDVNDLPTTVGGGTIHWDAKVPRFWRQDFKGLSLYGPVPNANVADWPITYEELAPYYDAVEYKMGVQGDIHQMPPLVLQQAPRSRQFVMPPGPTMYGGRLLAQGAAAVGKTAYPVPMAINSQEFEGRPRCNSCGFCSGYGCPINARGGAAVSFLNDALRGGAQLRSRCFVYRVEMASKHRAAGVSYLDDDGRTHTVNADIVILAASAMETPRLLLMSANSQHPNGIGNLSDQVGRNLMFHYFTLAGAFFRDDVHALRGPSTTLTIDDFVGPDTPQVAAQAGLPYIKGGIQELGGTIGLFAEAGLYGVAFPNGGKQHKDLLKLGVFRSHVAGMSMPGEDMPQKANRVDLDPAVRDVYGYPVPRITHSAHPFEITASSYYGPQMQAICAAAPGAFGSFWLPVATLVETGSNPIGSAAAGPASTAHVMGTARMGTDPATSVVDACSRMHEVDNIYIADGSVFTSSGGFNPTNTIMSLSLHMAHCIISGGQAVGAPPGALPSTSVSGPGMVTAAAAGIGAVEVARRRQGRNKEAAPVNAASVRDDGR